MSLTPYSGQWTKEEVTHLLRRCLFGVKLQTINDFVGLGINLSVDQLLNGPVFFEEPLSFLPEEVITAYGLPWVNSFYPTDTAQKGYHEIARRDSLEAWLHHRILINNNSIQEKMSLFWQNHFAASPTIDSRASFNYFRTIQFYGLGNFKDLLKQITVDCCMLDFLNGSSNTASSPNENYAREFLELFTLGKGQQIGPEDYTHYNEQDVAEGSKIFTGWQVNGYLSDNELPFASFNSSMHDSSTKTFSYHFNNAQIANANELEYINYIELVFQHPEVAKFICRKLYKWFVNSDITPEIETTIILEMANVFISNNYEIKPVLSELLKSQHFYDANMRGSIVKSPLDLIYTVLNSTNSDIEFQAREINSLYRFHLSMKGISSLMGQNYSQPPNVGGWKAYYQSPDFYKMWINPSLINLRFDFIDYITIFEGVNVDGYFYKINVLLFLETLSTPSSSVQIIDDLCLIFLSKPIELAKKEILRLILTGGLPDYEWTIQYNNYQANLGNSSFSDPIKSKLELTLSTLLKLPEFQVI